MYFADINYIMANTHAHPINNMLYATVYTL